MPQSYWCEGEGGEGENVHLLTHATARGMGKKTIGCIVYTS